MVETSPPSVGVAGPIPGRGAGIPLASQPRDQGMKQKQCCGEFNKDFKSGPHQTKEKKNLKKKKKELSTVPSSGKETALRPPSIFTNELDSILSH